MPFQPFWDELLPAAEKAAKLDQLEAMLPAYASTGCVIFLASPHFPGQDRGVFERGDVMPVPGPSRDPALWLAEWAGFRAVAEAMLDRCDQLLYLIALDGVPEGAAQAAAWIRHALDPATPVPEGMPVAYLVLAFDFGSLIVPE
ncbi:MAG: hypothetical protein AAFR17_07950 [Pseudomonadota bacterium]